MEYTKCFCGATIESCGNGWTHSHMHDNRFDHAASPVKLPEPSPPIPSDGIISVNVEQLRKDGVLVETFVPKHIEPTPPTETRWCITCEKWMPIKHDHPAPTERVEMSISELITDEEIDAASEGGEYPKLIAWTRVLQRMRLAEAAMMTLEAAVAPSPAGESQPTDRQLCMLSRLFNREHNLGPNDYFVLNKWLELQIATARKAGGH